MKWLDAARPRLRLLFARRAAESRMTQEFGLHIELETELLDDVGQEQRQRVGRGGDTEAGEELLGHASAADAVASARTAALVDPEGESLAKCLSALGSAGDFRIAAE